MKKATVAILVILSILIGFFDNKWWVSVVLISIFLILWIFRFTRTSKKGRYRSAFKADREEKELERRKIEILEAKKKAELKLERMEETNSLIWSGTDITVDLSNLTPKQDCILEGYEDLFGEYRTYPPIHPLFKDLLAKENAELINSNVRIFNMKEGYDGNDPIHYFYSFGNAPSILSMSAKSILNCFILAVTSKKISERNWFVLNTKYPDIPTDIEDLRMVDIRMFEESGKFMLHCFPYQRWSSLSGSWIGKESTFFIPLLNKEKVLQEENKIE